MPLNLLDNHIEEMPASFRDELAVLARALDKKVPTRQVDRNLLIASWNIRELGGYQLTWATDPGKSPKRNFSDLHYIAEILSRFDVIAIQELQDDLTALRQIMLALGDDWGLVISDVTQGAKGRERLGYLYDIRRVQPTGLVGELVLSAEDLQKLYEAQEPEPAPKNETAKQRKEREARQRDRLFGGQLDRTPYVASFRSAGRPFMLASVHLVWGDSNNLAKRAEEAGLFAEMLRKTVARRKGQSDEFRANLIALGDFNATRARDPIITALGNAGMELATELATARRTTADVPAGPDGKVAAKDAIAYDQFAFFKPSRSANDPTPLLLPRRGGSSFPWDDFILKPETKLWARAEEARRKKQPPPPGAYDPTYRISDHYPLWLELSVRPIS